MKKLMAILVLASFIACNDSSKSESTTSTDTTATTTTDKRANEVSDSTAMLDKMLADSNSTMTPDSLK